MPRKASAKALRMSLKVAPVRYESSSRRSGGIVAYRVEITARAEGDLADIYGRIQAENSPQAAKWFNSMARAMNSLEQYPKRAPITPLRRIAACGTGSTARSPTSTGSFSKSMKKSLPFTFYTSARRGVTVYRRTGREIEQND